MNIFVQNIEIPTLKAKGREEMYIRRREQTFLDLNKGEITFAKYAELSCDTYFNGLTVGFWKEQSPLPNLSLILNGTGRFTVRFGLHQAGRPQKWLSELQTTLMPEGTVIGLEFWPSLKKGMLYISLMALEDDARLSGGHFYTTGKPLRDVKLGIVITHYNRKFSLLPFVKRLRIALLDDERYKNNIALIIVDNSRDIPLADSKNLTVIPSPNYGGSGGFARGLLFLIDNKNFTHALFMDDDVKCPVESIRRTYAAFQFAIEENFTIAGNILFDTEDHLMMEKGVRFTNGFCNPSCLHFDTRRIEDLLISDESRQKPDFAAWMYFSFPLHTVSGFPFPFFVRGDDILFSIMNRFEIYHLNGITVWADDFGYKSNVLTTYLDMRSSLVISLLGNQVNPYEFLKFAIRFFFPRLFSYKYASAAAANMAIRDVASGTGFWKENLQFSVVAKKINSLSPSEQLVQIDIRSLSEEECFPPVQYPTSGDLREKPLRYWLRILSLNGFLLPDFLLKNRTMYQPKSYTAKLRDIFRCRSVVYEYKPTGEGFIAHYDRKRFFLECFSFISAMTIFLSRFKALRREYVEALPALTSADFWRDVYKGQDT